MTIQLDGFHQYQAVFSRNVSGWVFGNILFGGFIGLAVDGITGSIFRLNPEQVHAEMMANNVTYSNKAADSCIMVVMKPNPEWEKVGQLVTQ